MSVHLALRPALVALVAASAAVACRRVPPPAEIGSSSAVAVASAAASASSGACARPEEETRPTPEGFVKMRVLGVFPTAQGDALVLEDERRSLVLPIFVGSGEALALKLRADGLRFGRPLTHDLLDDVVSRLGGETLEARVSELSESVYRSVIVIRQGARLVEIDARPSDAIALAIGHNAPIFVAQKVVDAAALLEGDVIRRGPDGAHLALPPPGVEKKSPPTLL